MSNNKRAKTKNTSKKQKGGGSTDYAGLWYSPYADPAQLSRFTLKYIDQAPMFHPLETGTIIPTGTSGIIPTGTYYDAVAPLTLQNSIGPPVAQYAQFGGKKQSNVSKQKHYLTTSGKVITNPWIAHVFKFADEHGLKYSQALKHPDITKTYSKKI